MTWSLQQLRYFVAVAEASGVTAAAEALNISQPAISSAIAQLEVSLGGALFLRRQGRRVTLTPMGRRALEQARSLLIQAEDFSAGMLNPDAPLGGRLAVGCYHDLAPYFMPRLICAFGAEHPETAIELQEGDFEDMGQRLARGLSLDGQTEEQIRAQAEADGRGLIDLFIDIVREEVPDEEARDRIARALMESCSENEAPADVA